MFVLDGRAVTSASDLTTASKCEFAFLRKLDAKLGRIEAVPDTAEALYERTSRLGDEHENRVLERYRGVFGAGVTEIERPDSRDGDEIARAVAATADAFAGGADVVFQATFFDEGFGDRVEPAGTAFIGFADFIVRQGDGSYLVQDTKLARHARVTALLQLAAYAEQLERIGIRVAPTVELLLGDGSVSPHRLSEIRPVFGKRKRRLLRIIEERLADEHPVAWGDARYTVCGRCDTCAAEVEATGDLLLVGGLRVSQRDRFRQAGITSIDELAASEGAVEGILESTVQSLRLQAQLQLQAQEAQRAAPEGQKLAPPVQVVDAGALAVLPPPDPGDIFFDFEGDPLYTEGGGESWGLDYLFGLVETDGTFRAFWAHDWGEERQALLDFLDYVRDRRSRYPGMHIYHYASYERSHLLGIAARSGVGEDDVDDLLRENVLVDLYPLVKKALRVGSRSYSIKKLEPLYMGSQLRSGDVQDAATSITEYVTAMTLRATGDHAGAQRMLDSIADYNEYDCLSTLRLRDWLIDRAQENGIPIGVASPEREQKELPPSALRDSLLELARPARGLLDGDRSIDQRAAALAAAALDYHRREQKSFWWGFYARLEQPIEVWEDTRDVLIIDPGRSWVVRDWFLPEGKRTERRVLRLAGRLAPGSTIKASEQAQPFLLYEPPPPFATKNTRPGSRTEKSAKVVEVLGDGSFLVEENLPADAHPYTALPSALTPPTPPAPGRQVAAIESWAHALLDAQPGWPHDPMTDLLRRLPPRARSGGLVPVTGSDGNGEIAAVIASVLDLDGSYLAVQGPPGTGKTYLGAHVIAALVRDHGWRVGVVAQSHAVVENLLDAVVRRARLGASLVGKAPQKGSSLTDAPFTVLRPDTHHDFAAQHAASGFVLGGTAWDFSHPERVPPGSLDLLVIDEAGQFSLASTIAASVSARNLLLLGDPQQLPQVSQGIHPEPIGQSALGWISDGHDVLPAELGYFLPASRRMHPALAAVVSRLSYEGKLHSHPEAAERELAGVAPGLHAVPVAHAGDGVESQAEASEVVALVESLLGRRWSDPNSGRCGDPLTEGDLIVVTPYNAQLTLVRDRLIAAGHPEVRVGTVDKFQGQEAVIAIVSLAASSAQDAPRGLEFLLLKNRLNVAISRAQWGAYLVYSPELTESLPLTPDAVARLSAFIDLVEGPPGTSAQA